MTNSTTKLKPYFALRIAELDFEKLRYISTKNGRSVNKEVEQLIVCYIKDWKKQNGDIILEEN